MREFFAQYGKEIFALLVPLLTWLLNSKFKSRAKLLWASPHEFTFKIPHQVDAEGNPLDQGGLLHTASLLVLNVGKEKASNVEIIFNYKPELVNLWPARSYKDLVAPDGRYTVKLDSFAPREELRFEIARANGPLPGIVAVRCDECVGQQIPIRWVRYTPQWQSTIYLGLMLAGLGSAVYWLLVVLQLIVLKTPPL